MKIHHWALALVLLLFLAASLSDTYLLWVVQDQVLAEAADLPAEGASDALLVESKPFLDEFPPLLLDANSQGLMLWLQMDLPGMEL